MKRLLALVLLVSTAWLPGEGSFVWAASVSFLEGKIKVYPAQIDEQSVLIPFTRPPEDEEDILLFHHNTDVSPLKRLQQQAVMPKRMLHPHPHYRYGLTEGRVSDLGAHSLVVAGKAIKPLIKWKSAVGMKTDEATTDCLAADKGFATEAHRVLIDGEMNVKFYYLQEQILSSHFDKLPEKDKTSAIWMKEIVGWMGPKGDCHVLAYHTSDSDGLHNEGTPEPVGPIFGIMELSSGSSTERWLVLESAAYEVWGYTFIQLQPPPSNREPKRAFLVEGRP
jgi:hypothetical protein